MRPPLPGPTSRSAAAIGLLLALGLGGCQREEVVLQGVPAQPLLQERRGADEQQSALAEPSAVDPAAGYALREGVYVDVQALGGRSLRAWRDVLGEQLGALRSTTELPGADGVEMSFERGTIRVADDRVYMLRVPLPEPLRRTDALERLGFPGIADRYVILHREYRLNNEFGFRRIRMKRQGADNELVTEVEAWERVPGEPVTVR